MVVLADPLPDLGCHDSHNRIITRVISRVAPEDLNPQGAFFQAVGLSVEGVLDNEAKKRRVFLAVPEAGAGQDAFQLLANSGPFVLSVRVPTQGLWRLGATGMAACVCTHDEHPRKIVAQYSTAGRGELYLRLNLFCFRKEP